jgi:hypothetical protein
VKGDIDIFEDLAGLDAKNAVALDEVVAFASGVLTAEGIGEGEAGGELLGVDEEAGAIGRPWNCGFHALSLLGSRLSALSTVFSAECGAGPPIRIVSRSTDKFLLRGESECTSERARGQFSIFGAVEEKGRPGIARIGRDEKLRSYRGQSACSAVVEMGELCQKKNFWRREKRFCTGGTQEMQKGRGLRIRVWREISRIVVSSSGVNARRAGCIVPAAT